MIRTYPSFFKGALAGFVIGFAVYLATSTGFFKPTHVVEIKEAAQPVTAPASPTGGAVTYATAVDAAAPAVVNIYTTKVITRRANPFFDDPFFRRFFGTPPPRQQRQTSLGSGVIINEEGYILTNNHVIDGSDEILVALHDERTVEASIVGTDPETDLAVLKISMKDLPSIIMGDSDQLRVGDVVLAIGNPFGVGQTVTQGIVSAKGRSQLGISTFENFIQTDAAINPGNSGGALINAYGSLVGINTAIFSRSGGSQGIGFAIPVTLVKSIMKQIIEHGEAVRGWLGVEIQTLTPALAESFGLKDTKGIIIAGILRNGPADHAGLQAGDIITAIDGKAVIDANNALNLIAQAMPGETLSLRGLRNGQEFTIEATIGRRPTIRSRGQ
ncbi:MAG TPA: Do family serine endopeptidase [Gammaproteobacteria bacterium]|nr:Do family serine endopeptidase [Gammaproteobacteria bacterium]